MFQGIHAPTPLAYPDISLTHFYAGHDFFTPQPIKDAAIFFMRFIIHDWPDAYAKKILSQLRASAQPTTKLLLMDNIVPYASPSAGEFPDISGSDVTPVPSPLLPNLGIATSRLFTTDMNVRFSFCLLPHTIY
jgi:hypothetical protein